MMTDLNELGSIEMTTKKTITKKEISAKLTKVYLPIVEKIRQRLESVRAGVAVHNPALAPELTDLQLLNTALQMAATASDERVAAAKSS